jgi:hypothetical protein
MADDDRLDEVSYELIGEDEEAEDGECRVPVRKDGQGEKCREGRAQNRADVRDESQETRENSPEGRVRHRQKPQAHADEKTEADVEQSDREQIPADALPCFADGLRCDREMGAASDAQKLVADLLTVTQDEEDEDGDEKNGGDAFDLRRDLLVTLGESAPLRDDAHFQIGTLGRCLRIRNTLDRPLEHIECSAAARPEKRKFFFDVPARGGLRNFARDCVELLINPPAAESKTDHDQSQSERNPTRPADEGAFQNTDDRRQEKSEQHRQRHRHDDRTRQIEDGDDDQADEERAGARLTTVSHALVGDGDIARRGYGSPAGHRPVELVVVVIDWHG